MPDDAPWAPAAFEEKYATDPDPWAFASSRYELARYDAVVAALRPEPHRYRRGFEPGCSIGVLTERLAGRCEELLAIDVAPSAVARAQARCGERPGLQIEVGGVEDGPPTGEPLDLLVFSELGYYFAPDTLAVIVADLGEAMAPGGDLIACHWTGTSPDHRIGGHEVHDVLAGVLAPHADRTVDQVHDGFLLAAWRIR